MPIVVGYIPNPQGDAALDRAAWEARREDDKLIVVNASRSDPLENDTAIARGDQLLAVQRRLDDAGVAYDIHQPLRGDSPADEIVKTAAEHDASLIVIGLRHRTKVGKMLFGSTAQTVLLDAGCPVLAVKATD